jgi:Ca2+ transporting ATPase
LRCSTYVSLLLLSLPSDAYPSHSIQALNSLAENESLLTLPPWRNMYLVGAICLSMALHFMILYVPFFSTLFQITPCVPSLFTLLPSTVADPRRVENSLNWQEWKAVVLISFPVILIDEVFKLISNVWIAPPTKLKNE